MAMKPWETRNTYFNGMKPLETHGTQYEKVQHTPSKMTDKMIIDRLCDGVKCAECDCLQVCEYGKEAIKRGLSAAPGKYEIYVTRKPEPEWLSAEQIGEKLGLHGNTIRIYAQRVGIKPVAKLPNEKRKGSQPVLYDVGPLIRDMLQYMERREMVIARKKMLKRLYDVGWLGYVG